VTFDELKQRQSTAWGAAPFEHVAERIGDVHDELVARLAPRPGERWLDVATGTGGVAIRAARAGAQVTGSDYAAPLLETARRLAADEGLSIEYDVGDAEQLPYGDVSFDIVSSSFGVMFAPDQERAAGELARVTRPAGRLGLSTWRPDGSIGHSFRLLAEFQPPPPEGAGHPLDWGREEHVRELLGDAFELEFADSVTVETGVSGEEIWERFVTSFGPLKVLSGSLEPDRREELRRRMIEFEEDFREGDEIRRPREYLITIGTRRS
jgi:SAM-dependent methyltransferase